MSSLTIKEGLYQALSSLNVHGLFSCFGVLESCANPGLYVEGLGTIGLPLSERDAKAISQSTAIQQSPFGKGTETKVDTSVRKSWQINPGQFELRNPRFGSQVNLLAQKVANELGVACGPENVAPQLYKLLLYEEGSFFLPHQDSEKADHMFGTLTICLPSKHTGGEVHLSHDGNHKVFQSADDSEFDYSYAAWYADVTHEIKPVTSGYRLVLIYNLIQTNSAARTSASVLASSTSRLKAILSQWNYACRFNESDCPRFLAYKMSHKYTKAALGFNALKGSDHKKVQHLKEAIRDDEFVLYLAHIEKEVLGSCEEDDYGYGRGGYDNDSEESALDDGNSSASSYDEGDCHEIDEVYNSSIKLTRVVDSNDQVVGDDIDIEVEDIAQGNIFKRAPDDEDYSGYTGNEGVSTTHFYHDSVIVLMPQKSMVDFRFSSAEIQRDSNQVPKWLRGLQAEVRDSSKECVREQLDRLCTLIVERNRNSRESKYGYSTKAPFNDLIVSEAAIAALQLDDVVLFEEAVTEIKDDPSLDLFEAIRKSMSKLGFSSLIPGTTRAMARYKRLNKKWQALLSVGRSTFPDNTDSSEAVDPHLKNWVMDQVLALLQTVEIVDAKDGTAVAEVAETYGDNMLAKHVLPFVERRVNETPFALAFVDRLFELRGGDRLPETAVESAYSKILAAALNSFDLKIQPEQTARGHPYYTGYSQGRSHSTCTIIPFKHGRDPPEQAPAITAERLLQILQQCTALSLESTIVMLFNKVQESARTAPTTVFKKVMIPYISSLLVHLKEVDSVTIMGQNCGEHVYQILQQYIIRWVEKEPQRSADWSRTTSFIPCPCIDCAALKRFIQDPIRKEGHFSMAEKRRRHLEQSFYGKEGYTYTTIRAGSPHTLVIVKNDGEYRNLHAKWKSRLESATKTLLDLAGNPWLKKLLGDKYDEIMDLKVAGEPTTAIAVAGSKPLQTLQNVSAPATQNNGTKRTFGSVHGSTDVENKRQKLVEVVDLTAD